MTDNEVRATRTICVAAMVVALFVSLAAERGCDYVTKQTVEMAELGYVYSRPNQAWRAIEPPGSLREVRVHTVKGEAAEDAAICRETARTLCRGKGGLKDWSVDGGCWFSCWDD